MTVKQAKYVLTLITISSLTVGAYSIREPINYWTIMHAACLAVTVFAGLLSVIMTIDP